MKNRKKVMVLGSTGSIGGNTLDVIRRLNELYEVTALSCHTSFAKLAVQAIEFSPKAVALTGTSLTDKERRERFPAAECYQGEEGLFRMIEEVEADIVVNGIAGSRGLAPSYRTLLAGKDLALANKETIVMAGPLIMETARRRGVNLIPVDSEHHAIFQLLRRIPGTEISEIILTASGGAFRDLSYQQLKGVTVQEALKHPNWDMGPKITVDSATLANKGLEVIEAHHLFGIPLSRIQVLIHPQSAVHSLVRTVDGFLYAQISEPDMRMPIHGALCYPEIQESPFGALELSGKRLSFLPVDLKKYRMLKLARQAAEMAGAYPIVFNAANEVAVASFLQGAFPLIEIPDLVEEALQKPWEGCAGSIEEVLVIDRQAREQARKLLNKRERMASWR